MINVLDIFGLGKPSSFFACLNETSGIFSFILCAPQKLNNYNIKAETSNFWLKSAFELSQYVKVVITFATIF